MAAVALARPALVAREASEGPVAVAITVALARPAPAVAREASEGPVAVAIAARAVSGVATAGAGVTESYLKQSSLLTASHLGDVGTSTSSSRLRY